MLSLSDQRNFTRTFAGLSLIVAPLLMLTGSSSRKWRALRSVTERA